MISAKFIEAEVVEWRDAQRFSIGNKTSIGTPDQCVGVFDNDKMKYLLEIFAYNEYNGFKSVRVSGNHVVVGYGEWVHFLDVNEHEVTSKKMDGYFGGLYLPEDFRITEGSFHVLVASCSYLHHFTLRGEEIWKSKQLGLDGVTVVDVMPPLITVSGEWDPPGGWVETQLNLVDGTTVI